MTSATRLLLVDDDTALAENLAEIIQGAGYETLVAHDAEGALELVARQNVSAIITDYRLPGISGVELIRALRERNVGAPILMLSAYVDHAVRQSAVAAGARAVVDKPVAPRELLALVEALTTGEGSVLIVGPSKRPQREH